MEETNLPLSGHLTPAKHPVALRKTWQSPTHQHQLTVAGKSSSANAPPGTGVNTGGMETGPFLLEYRLGYNKTKKTAPIKHLMYWPANNCWVLWGCRLRRPVRTTCVHGMYTANTECPWRQENNRPPE